MQRPREVERALESAKWYHKSVVGGHKEHWIVDLLKYVEYLEGRLYGGAK